jgi:hypothetical protein
MKRTIVPLLSVALGIAATLVVVGSWAAQSTSKPQRPPTSTGTAAKPKDQKSIPENLAGARPDPSNFETYESYIEALIDWKNAQSVHTGRYQLWVNPNARVDTFLLDTETGRTWQRIVYTNVKGEPPVWLIQDRIDNEVELTNWTNKHELKPNQPNP